MMCLIGSNTNKIEISMNCLYETIDLLTAEESTQQCVFFAHECDSSDLLLRLLILLILLIHHGNTVDGRCLGLG